MCIVVFNSTFFLSLCQVCDISACFGCRNEGSNANGYEKASDDQAKHVSNILSADQSSNRNLKEEIKNEFPMNGKVEEKRVEKNFSIFEYVKFSDCEVNVFVNGLK